LGNLLISVDVATTNAKGISDELRWVEMLGLATANAAAAGYL